jgi:hypothetical protein
MVKRIAQGVRQGRDPRIEFLAGCGVPSTEAFIDAVGTHGAPFIMIPAEPDFSEISELMVLQDLLLGEMAVVVVDRFVLRVRVIKFAGRVGLEKEIVVDEGAHGEGGESSE